MVEAKAVVMRHVVVIGDGGGLHWAVDLAVVVGAEAAGPVVAEVEALAVLVEEASVVEGLAVNGNKIF